MEINIVYWADEKYSKYTYISVLSILKNTEKTNLINCFLFTTQNNKRIKTLKNLEGFYKNFKFNSILCEKSKISKLKTSKDLKHLTYSTYYRFFVDKLEGIEKIIYLDSDTIITWDIKNLFNKDLSNNTVWVVSDSPLIFNKSYIEKLNLRHNRYFNSWVMLINLAQRKKNNISAKSIALLNKNSYKFNDQDPLNIILENQCKYLEWKYNVQTDFFYLNEKNFYNIWFNINYYEDAMKNPAIIHFSSPSKPRHLISKHPLRKEYDKIVRFAIFTNISHWKIFPIRLKDIFIVIIHTMKDFLFSNLQR